MADTDAKIRTYLILLAFILFSVIFIGIFYLVTSGLTEGSAVTLPYSAWLIVAYAAGISMIFLPCTLPLAFIIVPLSMGKGYKKGLVMAVLFGIGLTITITLYGIFTGVIGEVLGLSNAIMLMFLVAGLAAFIFGLSELKIIKWKMPSFGSSRLGWVQRRKDYVKSFFLGLLLGNAGVGCPNPAFYWMLLEILGSGSMLYGASLGFVHGIGRATPLILLSILGIVGINATGALVKRRASVEKIMGWTLVIIGAFIIINGIPGGHEWYENTFVHQGWNNLVEDLGLPAEMEMDVHEHELSTLEIQMQKIIPVILLLMIFIPIVVYRYRSRKKRDISKIT